MLTSLIKNIGYILIFSFAAIANYYCKDQNHNQRKLQKLYFPNGALKEEGQGGPIFTYYEDGGIKSIGYMRSGILMGDRYYFGRNGKYTGYNFFDFHGRNLRSITY